MAVFMLDDIAGGIEVVVFPETFGKHGHLIAGGRDAAGAREVRERRGIGAPGRNRAAAHLDAQGADDARVVIHLTASSRNTMEGARGAAVAPSRRIAGSRWSST